MKLNESDVTDIDFMEILGNDEGSVSMMIQNMLEIACKLQTMLRIQKERSKETLLSI